MSDSGFTSPLTPGRKPKAKVTGTKSPRTPGGKSKKSSKSPGMRSPLLTPGKSPKPSKSPGMKSPLTTPGGKSRNTLTLPDDFDPAKSSVLVYEKTSSEGTVTNVPEKRQGIWKDGYSAAVSPTELWMFLDPSQPTFEEGSKHIQGVWGLDPDATDPGTRLDLEDMKEMDPNQVWFFSPQAKLPKYFTPRGVWIFPMIKRDITHLNPEEAGFLKLTDSVKQNKLDVGGQWRMLYRRDGLPIDEPPLGPGISPRKKKTEPTALTIHVKTPNGQKIPLENVVPTDTLDDIQKRVEGKEGTPKADQRLFFKGDKLDDPEKTVAQYGLKNGDVLDLEGITVYVVQEKPKNSNKPVQKLELTNLSPGFDTIADIQKRIEREADIPRRHQRLTYKGKAVGETPKKTLRDCKIVHGSTLHLEPMEITVKTPLGVSIPLQVDPKDTLSDISKHVQKKSGIPADDQRYVHNQKPLDDPDSTLDDNGIKHGDILDLEPMEIKVRTPKGEIVELEVDPEDTIEDIKKRIKKKTSIPVDEQRLVHGKQPLEDRSTLKDNGIKHGSTLDLEPMEIFVTDPNGKKYTLRNVNPSDTIGDIKDRLEDQEGIPRAQQRLKYNGKSLTKNKKSLRDYGIIHKSTLNLEPMEIKVQLPNGNIIPLQVEPSDKVKDIKRKLQKEKGIPMDEQRLGFEGDPLNDNDKLSDAGIKHGDTIKMDPMEVIVRDADGREFPIEVEPTDTIGDVKDKIEAQENIPRSDQRLAFKGKPLEKDEDTLRDCGVKHQSVLNLEPMTINVKAPDGKTIPVDVSPTDTMDDVKQKVHEKDKSIPIPDLKVSFKGKELPDKSTIQQNGLKHEDTVDLTGSGMTVIVKDWKNKQMTLNVMPKTTIQEIRERIAAAKEMAPEKQVLSHGDTMLDENEKTLGEYDIKDGDTIDLDRFKIYVEVKGHGKFVMEVEPAWKVKRIMQSVEARFKLKLNEQEAKFKDTKIEEQSTIESCGIQYKDVVHVAQIIVPEYSVRIGAWQDPFAYSPTRSPNKKVGVRKKTTHDLSRDFYSKGDGNTTLNVDMWDKEKDEEK